MEHTTAERVMQALRSKGHKIETTKKGYRATCPFHKDDSPSLDIDDIGGKAVIGCFPCQAEGRTDVHIETLKYCGLWNSGSNVINIKKLNGNAQYWTYYNEYKDPIGRAVRQGNQRWQEIPGVNGAWVKGAPKGDQAGALYNLPAILKSKKSPIVVVEGEKCADVAAKLWPKRIATTSRAGAANWNKADWSVLKKRDIWIIADCDAAGHKYAENVAQHLIGHKCNVQIMLPKLDDHNKGEDIADWYAIDKKKARKYVEKNLVEYDAEKLKANKDKDNYVKKNYTGFRECMEKLDVELRINELGHCTEFKREGGEWELLTDKDAADILTALEQFEVKENTPLILSDVIFRRYTTAVAERVDLFKEYLDNLPEWDGVPRIREMLKTLFDAKGKLAEWASFYPFIGILQRTHEPGAKIDEFPIFIGEKGIGKSEACQYLLPEELNAHGDAVDLSLPDKDNAERTQYKLIVELSEVIGLKGVIYGKLKTYISRRDDGQHRKAYGHNPQPSLRRFVFIGTSNEWRIIPNDPTGNRRLIPVVLPLKEAVAEKRYPKPGQTFEHDLDKIHDLNVRKWIIVNRDQLWAEAKVAYAAGARANLPVTLRGLARDASDAHRDADNEVEDKVRQFLKQCIKRKQHFITVTNVYDYVYASKAFKDAIPDKRHVNQLHNVITLIGAPRWRPCRKFKDGAHIRGFGYV